MPVTATPVARDRLRKLPTTARPVIDPADVEVPAGYEVEPVLVGLSFPCGMGFADDGTLFLLEGGSTWPTRPGVTKVAPTHVVAYARTGVLWRVTRA